MADLDFIRKSVIKKHKYKKDAVIHKYEQKIMRLQRGMQGLYPEQCGSGNVGLECASGPGHEYPLSRSLLSPTLLIQVLAQLHFTYPGPCSAPLYLSRSLRGLLISQWYLSRPGAWPVQSCNQSYDPQDLEFNLCGQKPAQVFLEPLDHEEKCFRNQKKYTG